MGGAKDGLVTKLSCLINGRRFWVINKTQTRHRLLDWWSCCLSPLPLPATPLDPPYGFPRQSAAALTGAPGQCRRRSSAGGVSPPAAPRSTRSQLALSGADRCQRRRGEVSAAPRLQPVQGGRPGIRLCRAIISSDLQPIHHAAPDVLARNSPDLL